MKIFLWLGLLHARLYVAVFHDVHFFILPFTDLHVVMFNVIPSKKLLRALLSVNYLNAMHRCLYLLNTHLNTVVLLDGAEKICPQSGI